MAGLAKHTRFKIFELFIISFLSTPVGAILLLTLPKKRSSLDNKYHYKCPRCSYFFTEYMTNCSICKKEGIETRLEKVKVVSL